MEPLEKIFDAINNSEEPLSTDELVETLGLARRVVYYNTHLLVKFGRIKRYKGLPGVFVSVEKGEA